MPKTLVTDTMGRISLHLVRGWVLEARASHQRLHQFFKINSLSNSSTEVDGDNGLKHQGSVVYDNASLHDLSVAVPHLFL